jgi:hypothetical protein
VTIDEWAATAELLLRRWPGQNLDTDVLSTWYELLADLSGEAVYAAVRAIALTSRQFVPNPGDIRERLASLVEPQVTFEQAWSEISRAISAAGRYDPGKAEQMLRQVPGGWDLVLAMGGWDEICHGGPIEQPPMLPGVRRAAGEHAWKALQEQRRTDVAAAPLPGLAGEVARERLEGDAVRRIAVAPVDARPVVALEPMKRLALPSAGELRGIAAEVARETAAHPQLKPEYRAEIEAAIREGRADRLPARWAPFVEQVRRELGGAA